MPRLINRSLYPVVLSVLLYSCSQPFTETANRTDPTQSLPPAYSEIIPPEFRLEGGGLLDSPVPTGSVRYRNPAGTAQESDIRLDPPIAGFQAAERYLYVSGTATPDDSGLSDRDYNSVLFRITRIQGVLARSGAYSYTFRVDGNGRFGGYLYFPDPGSYEVTAVRYPDSYLYPSTSRGTQYAVGEGQVTLSFSVETTTGIPESLHYLLPAKDVDSGNETVRLYAEKITAGSADDLEKARRIFEFLVTGDGNGPFHYRLYEEISPGFIDGEYPDVIIASHFLEMRTGVCNDFAELYAALARASGLDVFRATGYRRDEKGARTGHQWNVITIGGVSYRLDATWANGAWMQSGNMAKARSYAALYPEFDSGRFATTHEKAYAEGYSVDR